MKPCKRCNRGLSEHPATSWYETICGEQTLCHGNKCPDGKGCFVIAQYNLARDTHERRAFDPTWRPQKDKVNRE